MNKIISFQLGSMNPKSIKFSAYPECTCPEDYNADDSSEISDIPTVPYTTTFGLKDMAWFKITLLTCIFVALNVYNIFDYIEKSKNDDLSDINILNYATFTFDIFYFLYLHKLCENMNLE